MHSRALHIQHYLVKVWRIQHITYLSTREALYKQLDSLLLSCTL